MNKLEIQFIENSDYVECPDLGDKIKIVSCYRCKYFGSESVEKKEEKVYKEVINFMLDLNFVPKIELEKHYLKNKLIQFDLAFFNLSYEQL